MAAPLRTFVALELPRTVRAALGELQEGLRRHRLAVRWVRPDGIHLTLKFLGDTPEAAVAPIADALAAAVGGAAPMSLGVAGVGVFPGITRPRVLWAGLSGDTPGLMALQRAVEDRLAGLGIARETRAFKAHLTLGRAKGPIAAARLAEALQSFSAFRADGFVADAVTFFKSDLQPSGAVYTPLRRMALTGGHGD